MSCGCLSKSCRSPSCTCKGAELQTSQLSVVVVAQGIEVVGSLGLDDARPLDSSCGTKCWDRLLKSSQAAILSKIFQRPASKINPVSVSATPAVHTSLGRTPKTKPIKTLPANLQRSEAWWVHIEARKNCGTQGKFRRLEQQPLD